jgi:hypothetical protein
MARLTACLTAVACVAALLGCSRKEKGTSREVVLPLLQREAESLKADGEKVDPALQVKSVWNIEGVDVREQPNDAASPWAGSIRFRIKTETRDFDGSAITDEAEKRFDYVFSAALGKWIIKYVPTTPAPKVK